VEVLLRIHAHPIEETLEAFALRRLPEVQAAIVEEHLLVCEACQNSVENIDEYLLFLKPALAEFAKRPATLRQGPAWLREKLWEISWERIRAFAGLSRPLPAAIWASAMAISLAACMLAASVVWRTDRNSPAATVALAAFRGGSGEAVALGPAHRPLDLSIDIGELPASPDYRVEVVTSAGKHAWGGIPQVSSSGLSAHVEGGLRAGMYWARLYSSNGELLREFGLRVK